MRLLARRHVPCQRNAPLPAGDDVRAVMRECAAVNPALNPGEACALDRILRVPQPGFAEATRKERMPIRSKRDAAYLLFMPHIAADFVGFSIAAR
jgi:hypothetical protein